MNLSAVILTLNEEQFIENAVLSALQLTPHVVVLDAGSRDQTTTLAAQTGATIHRRPFEGFASQRQAALELVKDDWTLFLDADERLTPGLVAEIQHTLTSADDSAGGYWIPRRNIAFGRILKGGGWWPDYQLRLLRTRRASYTASQEVHEVACVRGAAFSLNQPIVHINYRTRIEFIRKQWVYTSRGNHQSISQIPRRRSYISAPAREFSSRFVDLRGYRDGLTGLFMASVMGLTSIRSVWLKRRLHGTGRASH